MKSKSKKIKQLERIIEGAIRIFSSHGYRQAQMSDIAKEIGISPGTLYLYFESKEALFEYILKYIFLSEQNFKEIAFPIKSSSRDFGFNTLKELYASSEPFAYIKQMMRNKKVKNVQEEFEKIIRLEFHFLSTYRNGITMLLNSTFHWPQLADIYTDSVKNYLDTLSSYLVLRIDQGFIRKLPDVPAAARMILETVAWFAVHRYKAMLQPNIDEKTAEETVVDLLVNSFIPQRNNINKGN